MDLLKQLGTLFDKKSTGGMVKGSHRSAYNSYVEAEMAAGRQPMSYADWLAKQG